MQNELKVKTPHGEIPAYWAEPDAVGKYPTMVLIHEVWGLTENIKDIARRFANEGYIVLAPDLISHTGVTEKVDASIMAEIRNPATRDEAQKKLREAMTPIRTPEFGAQTLDRLKSCIDTLLASENSNGQVVAVGYCFGGTYAWQLAINMPDLDAAVPYYGHAPEDESLLSKINCPVLAFYGEKDENLMKQLPILEATMDKLKKDFTATVYQNAGHAFFNDTNKAMYVKEAAEDSWLKVLQFFQQNLKSE